MTSSFYCSYVKSPPITSDAGHEAAQYLKDLVWGKTIMVTHTRGSQTKRKRKKKKKGARGRRRRKEQELMKEEAKTKKKQKTSAPPSYPVFFFVLSRLILSFA